METNVFNVQKMKIFYDREDRLAEVIQMCHDTNKTLVVAVMHFGMPRCKLVMEFVKSIQTNWGDGFVKLDVFPTSDCYVLISIGKISEDSGQDAFSRLWLKPACSGTVDERATAMAKSLRKVLDDERVKLERAKLSKRFEVHWFTR